MSHFINARGVGQLHLSRYSVTQKHAFLTETIDDPARLQVVDGVGYLTLTGSTVAGLTEVKYWPNDFTDSDYVLTERNWW